METRSDAMLVAAVLDADPRAFTTLVSRYRDAYTRFAVRMLGGNHADADEVLQSAFLRAYRRMDSCRDPERFGAWLYQIVVNECRTYAARRARRERRFAQEPGDYGGAFVAHTAEDAALREEIQRALDQLVPEQREAFVLKHVEELSYDEMAEITGVGVSALKMRVKRACEHLRALLETPNHV
jgi:RNA polymerase sigma-70 factor, ECF subfamily